jgi:hypothetical protein
MPMDKTNPTRIATMKSLNLHWFHRRLAAAVLLLAGSTLLSLADLIAYEVPGML